MNTKASKINALINKIALPADLSPAHRKALTEARQHIALEETYNSTGAVEKAINESYAELSTMARAFLSRAYAERKWAHAGKVYPYTDCLRWTGCSVTGLLSRHQTFAEGSAEAENA